MQASGDVEVEWQFDAIDLRPVERWLTDPHRWGNGQATRIEVVPGQPRRQVDQYLDTEDWRIGRAGLSLRIRQTGQGEEITLKDGGSLSSGGLRRRLEINENLPAEGVSALDRTGPVGRRIAAVAARRPLRRVLEVRTRRQPFVLSLGGARVAEVALDDTVISVEGDEQPARLRRVEVEADPEHVRDLEPVVASLQQACGLQPAVLSKFEAGLLALGLRIPGPPDFGPTDVTPESTMGELAQAVLRRHVAALFAHEAGTRLGEDIEELHDMRVATRRLRAALALFADYLPPRTGRLREELKWLGEVLGKVRDLDVQLERFTDMSVGDNGAHPDEHDALHELGRLLLEERAAAREELLEAFESPRWERLAEEMQAVARSEPATGGPATVAAVLAVPPLVLSRHRAAARAASRACRTGRAADFHRLRIRCKRLRYCLEFTTDLYSGHTNRFIRRLTRLQDALGLLQDAEVAIDRLAALAEREGGQLPPRTIFAMGGMAQRYRDEAARLLAQLPERVRVLGHKDWVEAAKLMERRRMHVMASLPLSADGSDGSDGAGQAQVAEHGRTAESSKASGDPPAATTAAEQPMAPTPPALPDRTTHNGRSITPAASGSPTVPVPDRPAAATDRPAAATDRPAAATDLAAHRELPPVAPPTAPAAQAPEQREPGGSVAGWPEVSWGPPPPD